MSLLSLMQDVSNELGGFAPTNAVMSSQDPQVKQLLALLNKEGKELARRYEWQALTREAFFQTVGTENQGTVESVAPGFKYIINDTIYNRTRRWQVYGPLSPQQWEKQKAMFALVPFNQYKIMGGQIKFIPVPSVGDDCYFEYQSKNWVQSGAQTSDRYLNDSDTSFLDEDLLALGLVWRWRAAKGMPYDEDFNTYERQVEQAFAQDRPRRILQLDNKPLSPIGFTIQQGDFPGPII